ncbi:MAG: ABC transporter permease [Pseudomonadales bacterium]|nr:ABC transporter permease [Pseudomonadales bacterium]
MYFRISAESADQKKRVSEVELCGSWTIDRVTDVQIAFDQFSWPLGDEITLKSATDFRLDVSGAWVLRQCLSNLKSRYGKLRSFVEDQNLLSYLDELDTRPIENTYKKPFFIVGQLHSIGEKAHRIWDEMLDWLAFLGEIFVLLLYGIFNFKHLRIKSVSRHIYTSGIQAIPIVALIAFLISVVLAYQGATQLRQFGADIYTVDLVALSVLREMGVLLTAIMVAGRSGSAFAAEIGVMKINQEVDAIVTMGMNPLEVLVLPRAIALMVSLPLLAFIADLMGIAGAAVLTGLLLDIPLIQFLERVQNLIGNNMWMFWAGIIKAPVFAFLIAAVGTRRGMQVSTSAEKVGTFTTQAVVESIFLVILADALFSILFSRLGI